MFEENAEIVKISTKRKSERLSIHGRMKSKGEIQVTTNDDCKLNGHKFVMNYHTYTEVVEYVSAMHEACECSCKLVGIFPSFVIYPKDFS